MKMLVSGFEPYGQFKNNPTEELVEKARRFNLDGLAVDSALLPVNYDECVDTLVSEIERTAPQAVVACGFAPGRTAITPERVGLNIKDTMVHDKLADNRGYRPIDESINPQGPDARFSKLPYRKMTSALLEAGIPAYVSNTAETFVCNNTLFGLLDYIDLNGLQMAAGFIHFPASTSIAIENPTLPSLPSTVMVNALQIILKTIAAESNA